MITPAEARARVDVIKAVYDDPEDAHGKEDELRHDVLQAIAEGSKYGRALAEIALTTSEIEFPRWCA